LQNINQDLHVYDKKLYIYVKEIMYNYKQGKYNQFFKYMAHTPHIRTPHPHHAKSMHYQQT